MITASPGTIPSFARATRRGFSSARTSSAIFFPSMSSPGIPPPENREDGPPVIALEAMEGAMSDTGVAARFRTRILSDKSQSSESHKKLQYGLDICQADLHR